MMMSVRVWWLALCIVSVLNVSLWVYSSIALLRRRPTDQPMYAARWPHLLLSAGYVFGCGFRSVLPRADVQRICLVDTWLSNVLVGRSVATVAELCFAIQWALLLRELSSTSGSRVALAMSYLVVPLIAVAEVSSWYAVLTTSYIGNAIEQSIWTATAALLAPVLFVLWRRSAGTLRGYLAASVAASLGFIAFMTTVDVPMYVSRWLADELQRRPYLSLTDGLRDAAAACKVTYDWRDWSEEAAWMTMYFSLAVWISIALLHAPIARLGPRTAATKREAPLKERGRAFASD